MRFLIITLTTLLIYNVSFAHAQSIFFESLYDIPVMRGLTEIPEEALTFDKPDGRISQAVAYSEVLKEPEIRKFYDLTLSQMGWNQKTPDIYLREQEKLLISIDKMETPSISAIRIRFQLMPQ